MKPILSSVQTNSLLQSWDDLVPQHYPEIFNDPYERLAPDQLNDLRLLSRIQWLLDNAKEDHDGPSAHHATRIRQTFAQCGLDADWLLSQREVIRQQRIEQIFNPKLDGQSVKLLGQVFPLEWSPEHQVTQFLLTPSLPNCSHMPVPSAHQVISVSPIQPIDILKEEDRQGTTNLYVFVEGTLQYSLTQHLAYRVDGVMRIQASYAIDPTMITPATASTLESVANQPRIQAEALLYPNLLDLIGGN